MAEERVQRRLAAILAADVVGYSRLMGADEVGTLTRLKTLRRELFDPKTKQYGGRIFKTTGDGAFVEFNSAVEAVKSAADIQEAIAARNAEDTENQKILLRIGISLGDVIVEGNDLYGNGVNVASRMEGLAEPGGICVSGNVHEHIGTSLDVNFEDLGEQSVKNIDQPIRCFRVRLEPLVQQAESAPSLPDKPSIAVLPFDNMSGDPEQEYFSDGITEDIITALSRVRQFFVIARNTMFTFKNRSVDVQTVAKELGVRYVLEGSVRKAGNRVRITVQLIDGKSGNHIWAERYDRDLEDIFALQDEITRVVVGSMSPELSRAEQARARRKSPESLDGWDYVLRGNWHLWQLTQNDVAAALLNFDRAVERDATNCAAFSGLGLALVWQAAFGWVDNRQRTLEKARDAALKAVSLDESDSLAHATMGFVLVHSGQFEAAKRSFGRALELNANLPFAEGGLSVVYAQAGQTDEAYHHADQADRLSPRDPARILWMIARSWCAFVLSRYSETVRLATEMTEMAPNYVGAWRHLTAALGMLGEKEEAAQALNQLFRLAPNISISSTQEFLVHIPRSVLDRFLEGLRTAGLPE